jgi:hypothetical protein
MKNHGIKGYATLQLLVLTCFLFAISTAYASTNGDKILTTAVSYVDHYNPNPDEECKGFVRYVYQKALSISTVPSTISDSDSGDEWDSYESCGFRKVADFEPSRVRYDGSQYTKEYFFREFFTTVEIGDAIQIDGSGSSYNHTMIVSWIYYDNGAPSSIEVIDANWNLDNMVRERWVSFDDMWNFMGTGGMCAYRYVGN